MIPVLDTAGARAFDKHHIERGQVPSVVLMENAGRGAAEIIAGILAADGLGHAHDKPIAIVCGAGNNGGDGFVVARHLAIAGVELRVFFIGSEEKMSRDARTQRDAFVGTSGAFDAATPTAADLSRCSLVVDALFGTGLARDLEGEPRRAVETINAAGKPVIALDLPSGIDADTGEVHGVAIRATHTITFGTRKIGLYATKGAEHAGRIHLAHIGVPASLPDGVHAVAELLEPSDVAGWLTPRSVGTHKHAVGQVVLFCGTPGTLGAAWMASEGALRAGAGAVTIATFADAMQGLAARVVEQMTAPLDASSPETLHASVDKALEGKKVALVGPGFGTDERAKLVIERLLASDLPLVMDADALTLLAKGEGGISALKKRAAPTILTPHSGELGRLLDRKSDAIAADRVRAVTKAQELAGPRAVVVLKGPRTLIAGAGRLAVNEISSPALATAGSGDTLAGITTTFACAMDPFAAACSGVLVHGMTSVRWSERFGDRGLVASDVAAGLPETLAELARLRAARR